MYLNIARGLPNYWDESNEWYGMNRGERVNKHNWLARVILELENSRNSKEVWAERFQRPVSALVPLVADEDDEDYESAWHLNRSSNSSSLARNRDDEVDNDVDPGRDDAVLNVGEAVVAGLGVALAAWMRSRRLNRFN